MYMCVCINKIFNNDYYFLMTVQDTGRRRAAAHQGVPGQHARPAHQDGEPPGGLPAQVRE